MEKRWPFLHMIVFLGLSEICLAAIQTIGGIKPGSQGSPWNWIDENGMFLVSKSREFAFGFKATEKDTTLFQLVVIYVPSYIVVWTANRAQAVSNSDRFVFDENGNAFLRKGETVVWSTNTSSKGVSMMELQDTGNLVMLTNDSRIIWQSFSHPTDTLLPNQNLTEGMKLISEPNSINNLTNFLEIKSGDVILSAGFETPQPYWSIKKESRRIINKVGDVVSSAYLSSNSWRFYDQNKALLWQFIFAQDSDVNATWIAVLGSDGFIIFYNLQSGGSSSGASTTKIPQDFCSTPEPCDSYNICSGDNKCHCPLVLGSHQNCKPGIVSPCNESELPIELVKADDISNYFALGFLQPSLKTDLNGCKASCLGNCSCLAMFFHFSSGNCFLLDEVGSFQESDTDSGFVSYIKEDMSLRPSMTKVVQMLEGLCTVPKPPVFFKFNSRERTSSGQSDSNSDAYPSADRLSGPR
ncbi:hypothetical protein L6164_002309 [Bauhinia variegata]|uniref:Uncharacterized protein n=1 Tax=Bauhinia variegata TaxID=167791 RepID=A0ACB9PXT6_BAUVA|nr:hypothetical protein L6164_002309 [Bauhinia variegata]